MITISYLEIFALITVLWIFSRAYVWKKNKNTEVKPALRNELKLLMFYICLIVLARIVYFPWHHINGHIGTLNFDCNRVFPPRLNLVPFVHLFDYYSGWKMNIIGNILMFIPVGIVLPACFKRLDSFLNTFLAGAMISLFIEISQLLFYERCSDVDDFIMNSAGAALGALAYFGIKKIRRH
ncbi:MAG: VanZ family protein [Treponema sp.]|nr:VanZ family protein [Treponema sp.]